MEIFPNCDLQIKETGAIVSFLMIVLLSRMMGDLFGYCPVVTMNGLWCGLAKTGGS